MKLSILISILLKKYDLLLNLNVLDLAKSEGVIGASVSLFR